MWLWIVMRGTHRQFGLVFSSAPTDGQVISKCTIWTRLGLPLFISSHTTLFNVPTKHYFSHQPNKLSKNFSACGRTARLALRARPSFDFWNPETEQSKKKKKQIMWPFELRTNPYMYCKERSWSRPDRAAKSSLAIDKSCAHKKVLKFADIHAGPRPARRHFVAYTCVRGRRHARVFLILNKIRRLRGGLFHGDSCRR